MTSVQPGLCICGCEQILTGRRRKYATGECQKAEGRRAYLLKTYGITPEEYETIYEYQAGLCAICGRSPKPGKRLAVDHSHTDGKRGRLRGLLCFLCNRRILGARSDSIVIRMAAYVTNPPAIQALGREVIAEGRQRKKKQPRKRKR